MPLTRTRKTLFLMLVSLLIAPWVHSFIKPFRLRIELPYYHANPTTGLVYHANVRNQPTAFAADQVDGLHIVDSAAPPPPLVLARALVRSTRPISGLRFDPALMPTEIRTGAISLSTYTGTHVLSAAVLEPHVRAGNQIANVRLEGEVLRFDTTGDDPNFLVPVPTDILQMPKAQVYAFYLLSWGVSLAIVLLLAVLAGKHGRAFNRPDATKVSRLGAAGGLALDLVAMLLMGFVLLRFVHLYTGFDISQLVHALDRDGVGEAVPREVRNMKALVLRHGRPSYVLADDLGKGDDANIHFQRATEYLYPARVVHQSRWVFARASKPPTASFGRCEAVDRENLIVLYDCKP
jgi:hypothetical protein